MPTKMQRTYVYQYCAIVEKIAQAALLKTKITNIIFATVFCVTIKDRGNSIIC